LLAIKHPDAAHSLKDFRDQGYFLSDGVKCRCDKGGRSHPPSELADNCGRKWLGREIDILNPDRICVLGKTALEALQVVHGYKSLEPMSVGKNCRAIVDASRPVLVWVFPGRRNSQYSTAKEGLFLRFARG
jgi:uracil-DNA glycosylase